MRLGLIARADNSGLGVQTHEFARHMNPDKVLVIDVGYLHNDTTHTNKATDLSRYPGAMVHQGWEPDPYTAAKFLDGLDVVFTAETFYGRGEIWKLAREWRVRTVLQPNAEFLDLHMPPDLWAPPTPWLWDSIPEPKTLLPVPIATDRFTQPPSKRVATHFLHVVGRPTLDNARDLHRNGTIDLAQALQYVTAEVTITIRCQTPGYVSTLLPHHTPGNVTLRIDSSDAPNYWDLYNDGDVLIMPRRFGGLCLPVNEALGAGMPVIMPNISPNEWLPQEWLIPAEHAGSFMAKQRVNYYTANPRALATLIDRHATDHAFHTEARSHAQKLRDELSWATLKPTYEKVLAG